MSTLTGPRNIGNNEQKIWDAVRNQKDFTIRSLHEESGVPLNAIPQIVGRMEVAGLVTIGRHTKPNPCKLIRDIGKHLPRFDEIGKAKPPSVQDKIWLAMKVLSVFTISDLTLASGTDFQPSRRYILHLEKAGYVSVISRNGRKKTYRFNHRKDTGFRSPSIVAGHDVYDRNLQKIVWSPKGIQEQDNGGEE